MVFLLQTNNAHQGIKGRLSLPFLTYHCLDLAFTALASMGREDQAPGLNRQLSGKLFGPLQSSIKSQRAIIRERLRNR